MTDLHACLVCFTGHFFGQRTSSVGNPFEYLICGKQGTYSHIFAVCSLHDRLVNAYVTKDLCDTMALLIAQCVMHTRGESDASYVGRVMHLPAPIREVCMSASEPPSSRELGRNQLQDLAILALAWCNRTF